MKVLGEPIKSPMDKRLYRVIELPNKLVAMMIQDDEADKSGASLDVGVGSSLDPKEFEGTAHFLEHMLFMGTEKYPGENHYTEFIKNAGGYDNAFTSLTDTNFHFECSNEAFEESLDIFAQFFICPSFSESGTEREMNAVDSEFNMSQQHDTWRFYGMLENLANKGSTLNKFQCGNLESLKKPGIRENLLNFHKKWYSANIMKLVISGNHTLDQMQKWVVDMFSAVVNKDVVVPRLDLPAPAFTRPSSDYKGGQSKDGNLCQFVKFQPVQDKDHLTLFFILPYCELQHETKPLNYYSHLFGHEGENSLFSYLKEEDLAMSLSAGGDHEQDSFSTFEIDIHLTKNGLQNYTKVLNAIFKYAQNLNSKGPSQAIFNECKEVGTLKFNNLEKADALDDCVDHARILGKFQGDKDLPKLIRHKYIADKFDKDLIKKYGELLADPLNTLCFLRSKQFETKDLNSQEYWYKIDFKAETYSEDMIKLMKNPSVVDNGKKLDLPPVNNLLPKNLDIVKDDKKNSEECRILKETDGAEVWYWQDNKFLQPRAYVSFSLYTNDCNINRSANGRAFVELWVYCLNEYLREFTYLADCADMSFECRLVQDRIYFEWKGYNDPIPAFVQESIKRLMAFQTDPKIQKIFDQEKEKYLIKCKNHYLQQAFRLCWGEMATIVQGPNYEKSLLGSEAAKMTFADFDAMRKKWMKSGRMVWFIYGNINDVAATKMFDEANATLKLQAAPKETLPDYRILSVPQQTENGNMRIDFPVQDESNENSCFMSYFQIQQNSKDEVKNHLLNDIAIQFIEDPTFNQLRTQEQLGYVVFVRDGSMRGIVATRALIQSPQKCASYIRSRFDLHLANMIQKCREMTEEEFNVQKSAVITRQEEKDKTMQEAFTRMSKELVNFKYNFNRQNQENALLKAITLKEFQEFFERLFGQNARRLDVRFNSVAHKAQEACEPFPKPLSFSALFEDMDISQISKMDINQECKALKADVVRREVQFASLDEMKAKLGQLPDVYTMNNCK